MGEQTFYARDYDRAPRPIISCVRVEYGPGHDVVHVWNHGGKAGTLTVDKGDGDIVARLLLPEKDRAPASLADVVIRDGFAVAKMEAP